MSVLADTSAFYALMVRDDAAHVAVRGVFGELLDRGRPIWTTSFIVVESLALLQHRIGLEAARLFDEDVLPVVQIAWVDEALYRRGTARLWREDRRRLSVVDCVSFEFMQREGINTAFAIDPHFAEAGFHVLPAA